MTTPTPERIAEIREQNAGRKGFDWTYYAISDLLAALDAVMAEKSETKRQWSKVVGLVIPRIHSARDRLDFETFWQYMRDTYQNDGSPTGTIYGQKSVVQLYGSTWKCATCGAEGTRQEEHFCLNDTQRAVDARMGRGDPNYNPLGNAEDRKL